MMTMLAAVIVLFVLSVSVAGGQEYDGDIGWIFTASDEHNTAGEGAAVGGGDFNTAQGIGTFTLGGTYNSASGLDSFIGGGFDNTVEQTAQSSMIGGGEKNLVSGRYSIVAGGLASVVSANYGAIIGGYKNTVSGNFGTLAGGARNAATAKVSTAFGFRAKAYHSFSLALGFHGASSDECETSANNQVALCCDSWMVNGVELMDFFSRRKRRDLMEYSMRVLGRESDQPVLAQNDESTSTSVHDKARELVSDGQIEDYSNVELTDELVAFHERQLADTRQANAELAKAIAALTAEVQDLSSVQVNLFNERRALSAERRNLADGTELEYFEDDTLSQCSDSHLLASAGSGEANCMSGCDDYELGCGAFVLDASDDCHFFSVCSQERGGTAIEGTVFKKRRVAPDAYDVDVLAYTDYQLMLAEEEMDLLEYETMYGAILTKSGTCASSGGAYLAMDVPTQALYLCDGGGTWAELTLLDTIPAPAGSNPPAPWHNFEDIHQDIWNNTDTHRYNQTEPLEIPIKPHDIDQCASGPCENNATCIDHGGALTVNDTFDTFECVCTAGFEGITCSRPVDDCSSDPCQNNATCTSDTYSYDCDCVAGYNGFDCEVDIDDCQYHACVHGTCVDGIDHYTCVCESGWNGTNCDTLLESRGYYSLGAGQCVDTQGLLPDKCTTTNSNFSTLFDCMEACDSTSKCDAVQFRHGTGACAVMLKDGDAPTTLHSSFLCSTAYTEIFREGFESGLGAWTIDSQNVLADFGNDTTYVKVGGLSFHMAGGAVVNALRRYYSYATLTSTDGITSGEEYVVSVWVYHVSNVISASQPSSTGSILTVSDSSAVVSSSATASADARHWELLSVTFTAQPDEELVIALEIPYDYEADTYWDEVIVWTAAGRSTVDVDGSLIQDVECYRTFESPQDTLYDSCATLKRAGEPNGGYAINESGTVAEYYCRGEFGGGDIKLACQSEYECDSCSLLFSESGSWTEGYLNAGLRKFASSATWASWKKIRLEWYDAAGDWQWVQFQSADTIFQNRPNNAMTQSQTDNTVVSLPADTFSTSVAALAAAVEAAAGALFCLSTLDTSTFDVDVAWAIIPADHVDYGAGCIGASWNAEGVFYSEASYGSGFVGYSASGVSKGITDAATHLDLNVYICDNATYHLQLWLNSKDYVRDTTEWVDHRGTRTVAVLPQDPDNEVGLLLYDVTSFFVPNLDISPSVMPELTISVWFRPLSFPAGLNWIVTQDKGLGNYGRGIMLNASTFQTTPGNGSTLALGIGQEYASDISVETMKWHHVVGVWRSNGTAVLYVNNVAFDVPVTGFTNSDGNSSVSVGATANHPVDVDLGEVRIYDTALSAGNVFEIYGQGSALFVN